jgi:hypothetical protein
LIIDFVLGHVILMAFRNLPATTTEPRLPWRMSKAPEASSVSLASVFAKSSYALLRPKDICDGVEPANSRSAADANPTNAYP